MVFTKQLTTVLLASLGVGLVIGSPLTKRDPPTVLSDLGLLGTDFQTLGSLVRSFDGNIANSIPVSDAESAVEDGLVRAISDTDASDAFSDGDSADVTSALNDLQPNITSAVDDIRPDFDSAGLTGTILSNLQSLRNLTAQLSGSLQGKLTPTDAANVSSGLGDVDTAHASAISAFS